MDRCLPPCLLQKVLYANIPLDNGPWLKLSPAGRDFISSCMHRDYARRIPVADALAHEWFEQQLSLEDLAPAAAAAGDGAASVGNNILPSAGAMPMVKTKQQLAQRLA